MSRDDCEIGEDHRKCEWIAAIIEEVVATWSRKRSLHKTGGADNWDEEVGAIDGHVVDTSHRTVERRTLQNVSPAKRQSGELYRMSRVTTNAIVD